MAFFSSFFGRKNNYLSESRLTPFDQKFAESSWDKIEEQLFLGKPSNLKNAVIDADKLVDFCLKQIFPKTESMGERLKKAKSKFVGRYDLYDQLWFAHKVRNEIVHNVNFELPTVLAKEILENFRQSLLHLGALRK